MNFLGSNYLEIELFSLKFWAFAGYAVRIAGQEVGRATFAHRHAILTDQDSEAQVTPLSALGDFCPINAPLTEQAVVAYEWGYAID